MPIGHLRSVIGRLRAFRWRYVVVGYHNRTAKILYPIVSCPSTDSVLHISPKFFPLLLSIDRHRRCSAEQFADTLGRRIVSGSWSHESMRWYEGYKVYRERERKREKERGGKEKRGREKEEEGRGRNEGENGGGGTSRRNVVVARSKWREKIAWERKRAGSRPGAGLLSLTEVPNTCGITGAGQVHRWRRKTKVFSTREPQDGILLQAAFLQRLLRNWFTWKIVYWTNLVLSLLFRILLSLRIYDRNHLLRNLEFLKLFKVI